MAADIEPAATVRAAWDRARFPQAPAIAIIDSGIDATRSADFGSRVVASVNVSSRAPGATGDQQGHGTMVAGIAAGASALYPGGAPNAQLVDVRTADGNGESLASDVIAGIDWILAHRAQYGIRVVNLSMVGDTQTSFLSDPLDKAVERLWFSGIVVVAAAGNNGTGTGEVDMSAAPGNDPFVITVGAIDQAQTSVDRRRLRRAVVVVRPHRGRFREAGAVGAGPLHRDAGAAGVHDRHGAARPRRRSRLHVDVGHVVRGPGRLRRGGSAACPPPELDARRGQGCADADGARADCSRRRR